MPDGMIALRNGSSMRGAGASGTLSAAAQAHGLTPRMFAILACAAATPGLSATEACRRLSLAKCAVSYATSRLAALGLARQEADPADLRRIRLFPSEAGLVLLRRVVASVGRPAPAATVPMASAVPVPETASLLAA